MSWQPVASIQLTKDWQLTEPITGSAFRLKHTVITNRSQDLRAVVAQAYDENNLLTCFNDKVVTLRSESQGFIFPQVAGILNRKFALKRLDNLSDIWTITIEVLDGMPESISLPIAINEVEGLGAALNDKAAAESLNIHVADTANPHNVTVTQIGAEPVGAGNAAAAQMIDFHLRDVDPHPQYANDAEIASVLTIVNRKEETGTAANAIATHEQAENPHSQYATDAQIGQLQSSVDSKVAGNDSRLSNSRTPTGVAGGVLSGAYPNPSFAAGVFARSLGNPGWEKLHSGKIEQWGSTVVNINSNSGGTIVFPIAFPSNIFIAFSINGDSGSGNLNILPSNPPYSLTGFNFTVFPSLNSGFIRVNWFVIGN